MNARFVLATVLAVTCVVVRAARADVPPPTHQPTCDSERSSAVAGPCQACEVWFFDADACERALGPKGLIRHCRTRGMTEWTEVWCGAQAAPAAPASAVPVAPSASSSPTDAPATLGTGGSGGQRSGCAMSASTTVWPSLAALATCALVLFARHRRA